MDDLETRVRRLEERLLRVESSPGLTAEQMYEFFKERVIGTKEFRNFLANYDERFKEIRDPDVDNEIDANARAVQQAREQVTSVMNREGQVVVPGTEG